MISPPPRPKAQADVVIIFIVRFHICASNVLCLKRTNLLQAVSESGISHQIQSPISAMNKDAISNYEEKKGFQRNIYLL